MADRIDAAMDAVKAAGPRPVQNGVLVEAGPAKLADRDHAVLASSDLSDPSIAHGASVGHIPTKAPGVPTLPCGRGLARVMLPATMKAIPRTFCAR